MALSRFTATTTTALPLLLVVMLMSSLPIAAQSNTSSPSTNAADTFAPSSWQSILTLLLLLAMLLAMALEFAPPDMLMMLLLVLLVLLDIIDIEEAVVGFSNTGMLTVAVLFAVAAGVQITGAIEPLRTLLERMAMRKHGLPPRSLPQILCIVCAPIIVLSAFLNNTPVVAMLIPVLQRFGQRLRISPSKLLIPLSYASILGGTCTLIGTSTNLVVIGLAHDQIPNFTMGFFEVGAVGLPVALAGLLYIVVVGPKHLPSRLGLTDALERPREYVTNVFVKKTSEVPNEPSLEGKSVVEAGLRNLTGLYLVRIERENGDVISAPEPHTMLQGGDKLVFAGIVDSVLSLTSIRGLRLGSQDQDEEVNLHRLKGEEILVEAVVAPRSAMVHRTIRDLRFRSRYHAAIVALHRHGERVYEKIGNIQLQAGDTLLLVTKPDFMTMHKNQEHFALVSQVDGHVSLRRDKAPIAVFLTVIMIAVSVVDVIDLLTAALVAVVGLVATRCMSAPEVRAAINLEILIVIAASFGISQALINSGAAELVATGLVAAAEPSGLVGLYIMVYLATMLFSSAVTNNAAITIMFPIALQAAEDTDADFRPFLLLLMLGASASFMTPTGYQTNLMVQGVGGYVFMDFVRFGGPLQIWLGIVTVAVVVSLDLWWVYVLGLLAALVVYLAFLAPSTLAASMSRQTSMTQPAALAAESARGTQEVFYYMPDLGLSPIEDDHAARDRMIEQLDQSSAA